MTGLLVEARPRRQARTLLSRLLAILFASLFVALCRVPEPVMAVPNGPSDTDPIGPPDPFVPPSNGFDWYLQNRFGPLKDGIVDFHWDREAAAYDPSYVTPSVLTFFIDGCRTEYESLAGMSENTYTWTVDPTTSRMEVIQGKECRIKKDLSTNLESSGALLSDHIVRLSITDPNGSPVPQDRTSEYFEQRMVARDYLIVSIGDSVASGEGNPDTPKFGLPQATWQDVRCHRSAYAGPAQAARGIESADLKTTVTFLSFAYSGATIATPGWDSFTVLGELPDSPDSEFLANLYRPDPSKYVGSGILGPYAGIAEAWEGYPDTVKYSEDHFLPSQIDQLRAAVGDRRIDALLISGGANDVAFSTVATACFVVDDCWEDAYVEESPGTGPFRLDTLVRRGLSRVTGGYRRLVEAVDSLKVSNVYVTEYPDPTRNDSGGFCGGVLVDAVDFPLNVYLGSPEISEEEAERASTDLVGKLNDTIASAVADARAGGPPWHYVGGIAQEFVSDRGSGKGHGYCASENWIRRANESGWVQGRSSIDTKGTLHPTARGHQVYAERLVAEMLPRLDAPRPDAVPVFTAVLADGEYASTPGTNGWFIGSCAGVRCRPQVVLQVVASDDSGIRGERVSVNRTGGCSLSGVSCRSELSEDRRQVTWRIEFAADGFYRLDFSALDAGGQTATFVQELKVDLTDPVLVLPHDRLTVAEGGTLVLSAEGTDFGGQDVRFDWDTDDDGSFETRGQTIVYTPDVRRGPGRRSVRVRVTDRAGRYRVGVVAINVTGTGVRLPRTGQRE